MESDNHILGWFASALASVAGALAFLWKRGEEKNAAQIQDMQKRLDECAAASDECYEDRLSINGKLSQLEGRLIEIERKAGDTNK